ncbi:MAG TPA: hypothetical protein VGE34_01910 [Candidatus Saccharimonadales bacterium]
MKPSSLEKLKHGGASFALILGTLGLAACSKEEPSEPAPAAPSHAPNWQEELNQWIGEQSGVYDKDGNVIPLDER